MSILFGIRRAEGQNVEEHLLRRMASATERYAPDGTFIKVNGRIGMGFQPYHTHQRSKLGSLPAVSRCGDMLTFDGRLDNYTELCELLDLEHDHTSDSTIALEAFSRWDEECFSRFIGDWALALWSHADRTLYLARDHAGTRTLFFEVTNGSVLWATHLEPFLIEMNNRDLDETFAAAYLSCQPIGDLTPYRNILAVSPAHYLVIREDSITRRPHWRWMVRERIRYASDAEYDEHFSSLFRQSVQRRTGPGAPILAELSGGMDSSSIVCMSDHIRRAQGATSRDLVDTVSYYDDSEPHWNEKPYFTAVEKARGKSGLHIEVSSRDRTFEPPAPEYLWPGPERCTLDAERLFEEQLAPGGYRVILSGIGGDELTGGPPDPLPELADYLISLQFRTLLCEGIQWGVAKRVPLIHLLRDAAALIGRVYGRQRLPQRDLPPWLSGRLAKQFRELRFHDFSERRIGVLPRAIDHALTWWSIMETLSRPCLRLLARREYRYPFLDRDLVDFLLRVPPNQLMRPGRRRLLLRRALRNIIPIEVLERRRKAYVVRGPLVILSGSRPQLDFLLSSSRLKRLDYLKEDCLQSAVADLNASSNPLHQHQLMRTIQLELWIRRSDVKPYSSKFQLPTVGATRIRAAAEP